MREKAEEELTELRNFPRWMFRLVKGLKTDSKEGEGGRSMRGSDGKLCFSEKERGKVWRDYIEWIMNEENDLDRDVGDAVEGPIVCVSREEVLQALNEVKLERPWAFRCIIEVDCCQRGSRNSSDGCDMSEGPGCTWNIS